MVWTFTVNVKHIYMKNQVALTGIRATDLWTAGLLLTDTVDFNDFSSKDFDPTMTP
jgi:hypothetical protein